MQRLEVSVLDGRTQGLIKQCTYNVTWWRVHATSMPPRFSYQPDTAILWRFIVAGNNKIYQVFV